MTNIKLLNKSDFALIISVTKANPNGDPLNANRPRQTYDGIGEISDVCLKRKLRNRLQDLGESIFVQSDDNRTDEYRSLNARYTAAKIPDGKERTEVCSRWYDVRAFGQVFAFKSKKSKKDVEEDASNAVSIGIRGPVTIQSAFSIQPITPETLQIVKSVNLETNEKEPDKKGSDTMGQKHRVNKGVYVAYGSVNSQLAQKTQFDAKDVEQLKIALRSIFLNDESAARPSGSMEVLKLVWWQHNCPSGQYSSAKVHKSIQVNDDGTYTIKELEGLVFEELSELTSFS